METRRGHDDTQARRVKAVAAVIEVRSLVECDGRTRRHTSAQGCVVISAQVIGMASLPQGHQGFFVSFVPFSCQVSYTFLS